MAKFKIGCSPLTNNIYAGKVNEKTSMWVGQKHDVTDSAVTAVAQHLVVAKEGLSFIYKGEAYVMEIRKVKSK